MLLDEIMAHKREELAHKRHAVPLAELEARGADRPLPLDFAGALAAKGVRLIAEVKRASPTKGVFRTSMNPEQLATIYAANGAAAISVLTDAKFFQGGLDSLKHIKAVLSKLDADSRNDSVPAPAIPIMRKDFIFDAYQVYESFAYGADALLLIVAVLSDAMLQELLALTHELGMAALVEVHDEKEVERAMGAHSFAIGINNRNLKDFSVDLNTFGRLRRLLPDGTITIAESGVHTAADVQRLARMGADAVLVGEALVTAPDVAAKVQELARGGRLQARQSIVEEDKR
jgi:indole-3-glycerol phosphate synthase